MAFKRVDLTKQSNQRNQAAALAYIPDQDNAPRVLATGEGKLAEKIIALAKENNIPVHEDPLLAAALSAVDVGGEIPPELYRVVAEVLAYVFRIRNQYRP